MASRDAFTSLVIAGGALKVISVIGCIKYLEEENMLRHLKHYVGSSAGSLMCFFLVLGYSYSEIRAFMYENMNDETIKNLDATECMDILSSYGLTSGKNLEIFMKRMLFKKCKLDDINFIELAKMTGKNLVVCASNFTKQTVEYFNVDTMPHLSVITAIRVSCSIPLIFTPLSINDNIYMDGGLFNNFPIDYFKNHQLKDILGIQIVFETSSETDSFLQYIYFILNGLLRRANAKTYTDTDRNIVTLNIEDAQWFSLSELTLQFPDTLWDEYISMGYNNMKTLLTASEESRKQT